MEGLFILFLVLFIASLVWLLICIVKLIRSQTRLLSKREMNKEAHKRAQDLKFKDPVITCDYCGRKINTKKEKVCPGCGASYGVDSEWKKRYDVSEEFVKKHADSISENMVDKSKKDGKIALIMIGVTFIASIVFLNLLLHFGREAFTFPAVRTDEVLNEGPLESYDEADYTVDGDGIIYEDDKIAIKVIGFYPSFYDSEDAVYGLKGNLKIGFKVTNKTDEKAEIFFKCSGVNGVVETSSQFASWGTYKKRSETTIYETLYYVPYKEISSICFDDVTVTFVPGRRVETHDDHVKIKTTAKGEKTPNFEKCKLLYSNDYVDFYGYDEIVLPYGHYYVYAVNNTDLDMMIECDGVKCGGEKVTNPYSFYDVVLRPGEMLDFSKNSAFNDKYGDLEGKDLEASFTIKFPDDPAKNQSTGYFDMQ